MRHILICVTLACALAACGGDTGAECGDGTTEIDGVCEVDRVDAGQVDAASVDAAVAEVGSVAECLVGGNVLHFDGNDYIYSGLLTVTDGAWSSGGSSNQISIMVEPTDEAEGLWWTAEFSTDQLVGVHLEPGVYEGAERAPFASPGHPGIDVGGDGRGCNTITGRFQVHAHERAPDGVALTSATISFEQHCEGGASLLSGCVHFER